MSDKFAGLADILVGSIHISINSAYAGAWFGTLLRGRAALMPDFAAEIILGYLERDLQPAEWDQSKACSNGTQDP